MGHFLKFRDNLAEHFIALLLSNGVVSTLIDARCHLVSSHGGHGDPRLYLIHARQALPSIYLCALLGVLDGFVRTGVYKRGLGSDHEFLLLMVRAWISFDEIQRSNRATGINEASPLLARMTLSTGLYPHVVFSRQITARIPRVYRARRFN